MILAELREYLRAQRRVDLATLATRFDTDPEAMRGMIEHWVRKGKVAPVLVAPGSGCAACASSGCSSAVDCAGAVEVFEWIGH